MISRMDKWRLLVESHNSALSWRGWFDRTVTKRRLDQRAADNRERPKSAVWAGPKRGWVDSGFDAKPGAINFWDKMA